MSTPSPNAAAFGRFVSDVRRYVRRRVDDPSVQDDLVQEVFVRVLDRLEQLPPTSSQTTTADARAPRRSPPSSPPPSSGPRVMIASARSWPRG